MGLTVIGGSNLLVTMVRIGTANIKITSITPSHLHEREGDAFICRDSRIASLGKGPFPSATHAMVEPLADGVACLLRGAPSFPGTWEF